MNSIKSKSYKYLVDSDAIPYQVYFNVHPQKVAAVFVLGSGQVAKLPKMVASHLKVNSAVIQGLPHWHALEDGSNLMQFTLGFADESIGVIARSAMSKITLVAESQAAPGAVAFTRNNPSIIKRLILIQPLGLNRQAFANSKQPIMSEFRSRVQQNSKHQIGSIFNDWKLFYNHYTLLRRQLGSDFRRMFDTHYEIGLNSDITYGLREVIKVVPVHLVIGEKDEIFKPAEITSTLKRENIALTSTHIVTGVPHSPLVSRAGRKLIKEVEKLC